MNILRASTLIDSWRAKSEAVTGLDHSERTHVQVAPRHVQIRDDDDHPKDPEDG